MRRHLKRRKEATVELNLAAMLDMAFQLLTFFILTFRPAPVEGELGLHLPPPVAMTQKPTEVESSDGGGSMEMSDIEKLDLMISSDDNGQVSMIKNGLKPMVRGRLDRRNLDSLNEQLKNIFASQAIPLDRIQLAVDERLRYEELMKIVDVCTKQQLKDGKFLQRISFIAVPAPSGG